MYWGPEQDQKQKKAHFQVNRKELKRRGRKRLNPSDVDTQRFQCFCTKQYRSYAALYGHVKLKHKDFFRENRAFGGTNTVDTFDPNHGYKIRKVLVEKIQFSSDLQKTGQGGTSVSNNSSTVPPQFNLTPMPDFAPKAKVTRNFNHYLEEEQRTLDAIENDKNKRPEQPIYVPRSRTSLKSPHDLDFQEVHEKIRQATTPEELKQLTKKTLDKIIKSQYVIDKFQEGKYYEIHEISRLAQRLEYMKKIQVYVRRKRQIVQEKMTKYEEIIYRQRQIVDSYERIILALQIQPVTKALLGSNNDQMEIQEESGVERDEGEEVWQEEVEDNPEQWDQDFE